MRQPRPAHSRLRVRDHGLVRVAAEGAGVLAAVPVAAGGAQGAHGGGVAAALGGEVAAVAEHVRPAAQRLEVLVRVVAELEAGGDQPSLVGARVGVGAGVVGGDPAGRDADRLGGLGGVLGQVGGDRDVGDLAVVGERTTRGSTWAPQVMSQPFGLAGWLTVANQAELATVG